MTNRLVLFVLAFGSLLATTTFAQETGRITGRVARDDGSGVGGVTVVVNEISAADITDQAGTFTFDRLPAGTYSITFILGENADTESGVAVGSGATAVIEKEVDWEIGFVETLTVTSASLQRERIVEAHAAIAVVGEQEISRKAAFAQIPKLLEFTPSAQVTQSGLYDYNINTRGFNSSLNRRVATLIDGRNPAVPFLGAQEWAGFSFPVDDLASVELLRGPSAALYGANASSGVLNMTTKAPRQSPGGRIRFVAGEIDTVNLDFRWAGALGNEWYLKAVAGLRSTGDYTVSRTFDPSDPLGSVEYSVPCPPLGPFVDCLPLESVPLDPENDDKVYFGGVRADKLSVERELLHCRGRNCGHQWTGLPNRIRSRSVAGGAETVGTIQFHGSALELPRLLHGPGRTEAAEPTPRQQYRARFAQPAVRRPNQLDLRGRQGAAGGGCFLRPRGHR